jgi:molybdopterin converting factor small subunit
MDSRHCGTVAGESKQIAPATRICVKLFTRKRILSAASSGITMRTVTAVFFGPVRELTGTDTIPLDVAPPYTGEAAFDAIATRFPGLRPWRSSLRLAVNREYTSFGHVLVAGDEISFLPPVSGG